MSKNLLTSLGIMLYLSQTFRNVSMKNILQVEKQILPFSVVRGVIITSVGALVF